MHFELLLTGKIPSGKGGKHARDRLSLRLQIHEQMKNLWSCEPLRDRRELLQEHRSDFTALVERHNRKYITPVRESLSTACKLDVVFYEPSGSLRIKSDVADPDNRLAGLLDILSIPPSSALSDDLPSETFTLMEDDKLLWGVSVERRRLLRSIESSDVFCRVSVKVIPTTAILGNPALIDIPGH